MAACRHSYSEEEAKQLRQGDEPEQDRSNERRRLLHLSALTLSVDALAASPGFTGTLSAADLKEGVLLLDLKVTGSVCGAGDQRPVGGVCRVER